MRALSIFTFAFLTGTLIASLLLSPEAYAIECDQSCPSGTEMASFADGDTPTCACVRASNGMITTDETAINLCDENDDGVADCVS